MRLVSLRHLKTGSKCPPSNPGIMRVYHFKYCPFAERTLLTLEAKKLEYEVVHVSLKQKPEWLFEKNPLGKVPTFELDGKSMIESNIISDYLDEKYPDPPLYSVDPWKKAQDKMFAELINDKLCKPFYKFYSNKENNSHSEMLEEVQKGLQTFEDELNLRRSLYFFGENPGMLDIMLWPFMERIPIVYTTEGSTQFPPATIPKLSSWYSAMLEQSFVKKICISPEEHKAYFDVQDPDFKLDAAA